MSIVRRDQFAGSNNITKPERLPEGAVVDAVNMDFTVGGKAELRTGFELVRDYGDIRAVFAMGESIAVAAGDTVKKISGANEVDIATIANGAVSAVWHNGQLFLNTHSDSIRIADTVESWAISAPVFDIELTLGNFPPGIYKIAVTSLEGGVESGCSPMTITLGEGQGIRVNVQDNRACRLYSSVANSSTLYHQGVARSTNLLSLPVDDTARLITGELEPLPFCNILESHNAIIVGAYERFVFHTKPMLSHLHHPEEDYLQFSEPVTIVAAVTGGLYVCADKTYFITGIGSNEMTQRVVQDFGAVAGTLVKLPDGSASWFCKYGQVIARSDGSIELINRASYAPSIANDGAAGYLEHNGNQMIVTTMRGEPSCSGLKSSDYWDLEVIQ